ncbi:uncharacterized protein LOC122084165 [Macadamia integrifolia]|uniref:uncharacterized protein LOC122084165 n=1 Tax=Macadamia integrifolia TaxID=60698 RepID=UPI001C4F2A31|nr:uncharacterized protein LOC122084165 [Macadamia integrifolia]
MDEYRCPKIADFGLSKLRGIDMNVSEEEIFVTDWVYDCFDAGALGKLVGDEEVDKRKLDRMKFALLFFVFDILPSNKSLFADKVGRPISTAIYFLLPAGSVACLHRIPCAETFHFYMGEPLTVLVLREDGVTKMTVLGLDLEAGERPQYTVPPNVWFGTYPTKDISVSPDGNFIKAPRRDAENHYSLVGVTCAPAFQFQDPESANCLELIARFPEMEFLISYLTSHN